MFKLFSPCLYEGGSLGSHWLYVSIKRLSWWNTAHRVPALLDVEQSLDTIPEVVRLVLL